LNRTEWRVFEEDLNEFDAKQFKGIDLIAGGIPCPPFSIAGKQLGNGDERDLFPAMLRIVDEVRSKAVMIENVRGLHSKAFADYRAEISSHLTLMGYASDWRLLNASDFGVPQLRPRLVMVAIRKELADSFDWPEHRQLPQTVGQTLTDLMASHGWKYALQWAQKANDIAPTIMDGSKKHGGPDLGPTRAKREWAKLGVDGMGIANEAPEPDFEGMPRLTVRMVARLQGLPDEWDIYGRKTSAYRQVGNAFPPPVAKAVSLKIWNSLTSMRSIQVTKVAG
jgi:DNA (cytosine-5)-methyltransferase 1